MFDTIVIGVDGRSGGEDAIALARVLADPGATLVVGGIAPGAHRLDVAQAAVGSAAAASPELRGEVRVADGVGTGLASLAADVGADLVVVGSCHHGPLGRVLAGSDVVATLRSSRVPVAVAPRGHAREHHALRTVGVAVDGSELALEALDVARSLAARDGGSIRAVQALGYPLLVGSPMLLPPELDQELLDSARAHVRAIAGDGATVELGGSVEVLEAFAAEVDLLLCGLPRRGPFERLLAGATAERLAGRCAAPVLAVPAATG